MKDFTIRKDGQDINVPMYTIIGVSFHTKEQSGMEIGFFVGVSDGVCVKFVNSKGKERIKFIESIKSFKKVEIEDVVYPEALLSLSKEYFNIYKSSEEHLKARKKHFENLEKSYKKINLILPILSENGKRGATLKVKRLIIDYLNREFGENHGYDDFDMLYPDLNDIDLAYTTTPDECHEIKYKINLIDLSWSQLVDDISIASGSFFVDGCVDKARDNLISNLSYASFDDYVAIDDEDLFKATGFSRDEDGNFY